MSKDEKFQQNWERCARLFGTKSWDQDPDFLYFVEIPLPLEQAQHLYERRSKLWPNELFEGVKWLETNHLHITLALPGRMGTHFQKNDVTYMGKALAEITEMFPVFELQFERLNVFENVLFAEVSSPSGALQALHEEIALRIPFSQHPDYRFEHFLPHVSLGYGGALKKGADLTQIDRHFEPLSCQAREVVFGRVKDLPTFSKEVLNRFSLQKCA